MPTSSIWWRPARTEKPDWNKWTEDDVSLVAMPIFHIGGSGWGVMGLYHGAKGVIAREFDPTKVLDFFEQSGITKAVHGARRHADRGAAARARGKSIFRG